MQVSGQTEGDEGVCVNAAQGGSRSSLSAPPQWRTDRSACSPDPQCQVQAMGISQGLMSGGGPEISVLRIKRESVGTLKNCF